MIWIKALKNWRTVSHVPRMPLKAEPGQPLQATVLRAYHYLIWQRKVEHKYLAKKARSKAMSYDSLELTPFI